MEIFTTTFYRHGRSATVVTQNKGSEIRHLLKETEQSYKERNEAFAMAKEYLRKKEKANYVGHNN